MYKAFILLFFLFLFSGSSAQTIGQVTRNESQPANETSTEAERLLHEGIELTEAKQFAQAVRALEDAIKLNPEYAEAYAALGRAYFKMREWRRAVDNLHHAAALNAKLREAKKASQQSAAPNAATSSNTNAVQTPPQEQINTKRAEPVLVKPEREKQPSATTALNAKPSGQTPSVASGEVKPQLVEPPVSKPAATEPTGPITERSSTPPETTPPPPTSVASPQPQKVSDANTTETPTSRVSTLQPPTSSAQPQRVPDPNTTETPTSTGAPPSAVEVTQRSPEVTQDEKTTAEVSPPKSEVASATEEKQEPTGASVSMSASPTSSSIESGSVSPIPLNLPNEDIALTKVYRVAPGDVLDVRINEAQPQQSTLFTITPAGLLEHPLLPEPLNVSTLTTEEIETKIQDDLKKRALNENPAVTVGVRDYASHTILVSGLVKDSGTKFLRREAIPLYVVVADAQPLPEAARVTVVRNELSQMFEIDLTNVAQMNLLVRPGDVINLQPNETQFIYVGGEVKDPGEKIFRRGLTLTQAIISAGGMTSKSKVAEIGRDDGEGFLVKTAFKLKDIQTGKAMDPTIRAGDRIMILR